MTTSVKPNFLPSPSLISNLEQVLAARAHKTPSSSSPENQSSGDEKPVVLLTNADGIESEGLAALVGAVASDSRLQVCVCAPQTDRSKSGHAVTVGETVSVCSVEINGALAYEVSGTPVDCVSLALSGALFSLSKPALVISGINKGSSSGHNMIYSGAVAAAREALICGVPSLCISLNLEKDGKCESNMKEAIGVCLPLINAVVEGVLKGVFPGNCLLNVEIPNCRLPNKGFKLTKQSQRRSNLSWRAVSAHKHPSAGPHFMSNQQSLGIMLAQLGRDASAAGAARRSNLQRKNVEVESVGVVAGKQSSHQATKRYFRSEFVENDLENEDNELEIRALEDGFVLVTPLSLSLSPTIQSEVQTSVSNWFCSTLAVNK